VPSGALIDPSPSVIDTALRWNANTKPGLAGYEVVWGSPSAATFGNSLSFIDYSWCGIIVGA
jgi:hypothetical protein